MCSWQMIFFIASTLRKQVNGLTTGIRQAENSCRFVEALSCRIVAGRTDDLQISIAAYIYDKRIAAGNGKAKKRRLKLGVCYVISSNMAFYVVNRNKRHIKAKRNCLCKVKTDKHGADKPRCIGNGNSIYLALLYTCGLNCSFRKS